MMGQGFGQAIGDRVVRLAAILVVGAFTFGMVAMWGIPKLWQWIKPILHTFTG